MSPASSGKRFLRLAGVEGHVELVDVRCERLVRERKLIPERNSAGKAFELIRLVVLRVEEVKQVEEAGLV